MVNITNVSCFTILMPIKNEEDFIKNVYKIDPNFGFYSKQHGNRYDQNYYGAHRLEVDVIYTFCMINSERWDDFLKMLESDLFEEDFEILLLQK